MPSFSSDLGDALKLAYSHLALVQSERTQADVAAGLLESWAFSEKNEHESPKTVNFFLGKFLNYLGKRPKTETYQA